VAELTKEIKVKQDVLIALKISLDWKFTYINDAYMEHSGIYEEDLIDQPVHTFYTEDMPKSIIRLMHQNLEKQNEFSAYMKNIGKNGYYWTFTNVSPTFDTNNKLTGYFSIRRYPDPAAIEFLTPLYKQMHDIEQSMTSETEAMDASMAILDKAAEKHGGYNEFIFSFDQ